MNINLVKIFGLQRSGTNLLEFLLPLNFKVETCKRNSEESDYLGWKHANPKLDHSYEAIEKITNDKIYFIFSIREKEDWLKAIRTKHLGNYDCPYIWDFTKNTDNFILNTPCGPEVYSNLEEYYDIRLDYYSKFIQRNPERSILIQFEDLAKNQEYVLDQIKEKFNFDKINYGYFCIKNKINCCGEITQEIL